MGWFSKAWKKAKKGLKKLSIKKALKGLKKSLPIVGTALSLIPGGAIIGGPLLAGAAALKKVPSGSKKRKKNKRAKTQPQANVSSGAANVETEKKKNPLVKIALGFGLKKLIGF